MRNGEAVLPIAKSCTVLLLTVSHSGDVLGFGEVLGMHVRVQRSGTWLEQVLEMEAPHGYKCA